VRCDWGKTLTELCEERYLKPVEDWARAHHTRFRSQTYGTPPVALSSNAIVDLPEGEHPNWRTFSQTRWAASASHLYGKPVTSSETWTWLHSPVFRATPLDMKAEADLHFLQGINQLIGHGWPYSPPDIAGYPGWRFYAAAVFNNDNPWWIVMPDVTKYLQRMSYLLRQGKPANDVALYLPTSDAYARFTAGRGVSVDRSMDYLLGPNVIPQILDAGYNFDYIDDAAIEKLGIQYPILILPGVQRIPLAAYKKIEEYARKGGIVVATRRLPEAAPGLLEGERDTAKVKELSEALFGERGHFVNDEETLGEQLHGWLKPDFATEPKAPAIGFVHRKLDDGDVYFLVNTSNQPVQTQVKFRAKGHWVANLTLAPYESRVVTLTKDEPAGTKPGDAAPPLDLSADWKVTFAGLPQPVTMHQLRSWTEDEKTKFFSGQAVYERSVTVPPGRYTTLQFGEGTPVPETPRRNGMRVWLDSPVREAAVVYINDQRAGSVWCPPYQVDVTKLLHPGENRIRIVVANLAINALAGQKLPDYKELIAKYGDRFQPQDLNDLKPLPAGLLGHLQLTDNRAIQFGLEFVF
jgi:alpha-L-rhamnosidase